MATREARTFTAEQRRVDLSNGTVLFLPDVPGTVKQWLPRTLGAAIGRMPAETDEAEDFFDAALAEHEILQQEILQLDLQATPAADDVTVIYPAGEIRRGERRVLLYRDESGGFTWHFPEEPPVVRTGDPPRDRFVVPLRTAAARESLAHRGLERGILTKLGRKLFKILVLPLAPLVLEKPLRFFVRKWEERKRREIVRTLTPDDYRDPNVHEFTQWDHLASGRGLLVVHGIFSSTYGMLSRLSKQQMEELYARYEGRVFAFDHFTVSKSPEANARDLVKALRARLHGREIELDVLTHSRGGIVARTLRERTDTSTVANFRKIFFVAPPNHGSALADAKHIVHMIDVFTNLITDFPDGPIAYSIEVLLALVKCVAFAGIKTLDGIRDMQPGGKGYIESKLNARSVKEPGNYACVTANYDPDPAHDNGFFTGPFLNGVIDRVFGSGVENDLVVPTRGAYQQIGLQSVDIESLTFRSGVSHTTFFADERTVGRALDHFGREDAEDRFVDETYSIEESYLGLESAYRPPPPSVAHATAEAPPAAEPALLRRDPFLVFHENVDAGKTEELTLSLVEVAADAIASLNVLAGAGVDAIDVNARVIAPGFDVEPPVHTMTLRRQRVEADETKVFALTAHDVQEPTRRTIFADFSIGTIPIGGVSHVTTVLPPGELHRPQEPPPTEPVLDMAVAQRERCDMKIAVLAMNAIGEEAQPPFLIVATSAVAGNSYDDHSLGMFTPKHGDVKEYLQTTLGQMLNSRPTPDELPSPDDYQTALAAWNANMIESLREFGTELWSWLPDAFKTRYFEHVDTDTKPRSILINSVDMYFPWELVVPWRNKADGTREELAPLGQAHKVGRWRPTLPARPEPQHFALQRIALVHPDYAAPLNLDGAREESNELFAFFGQANSYQVDAANAATVKTDLLDASDVQLMHFCGHAMFDAANPDQSYLVLGDESPLTALKLAASKLTSGKPFIVLNACSVGQPGTIASRAGGFAAKCLNRGCSAVLAAFWPVTDRSAKEFSLALYGKLKAGHSIGEALQELRSDHADNPTYQAYTYFGDPLARLLF